MPEGDEQGCRLACFPSAVENSWQTARENWSGCRDSNPGPPDPQSGALARLRYIPIVTMLCGADATALSPAAGAPQASVAPASRGLADLVSLELWLGRLLARRLR